MEWQPIETAPKSGEYLVYQPEYKAGRNILPARVCMVAYNGLSRASSHWMPLPAPPQVQS